MRNWKIGQSPITKNWYIGKTRILKNGMEVWTNTKEDITDIINVLFEEKDQQIRSLEEQLKNAIVPKFKIGQEVWFIHDNEIQTARVKRYEYDVKIYKLDTNEKVYSLAYGFEIEEFGYNFNIWEDNVFAIREEAEKRLDEQKGK